jgi:ribosomal-protein-alanine N-acetyltransferase
MTQVTVTRLLSVDDAEELVSVLHENRDFLAPWEPLHDHDDGHLAGRININDIIRGAFQSATIGYWVSQSRGGRGLATAAVADAVGIAFKQLGLHRLQAGTLLHNARSQRVLTGNRFQPFAIAPAYLKIAGRWQDHILFHLLNPAE